MAAKKHYWEKAQLKLYFNSSADHSIDENGAKKYNKKATAEGTDVTDLQNDLIATGYLVGTADGDFGPKTKRALLRFQRRAKNSLYRIKAGPTAADVGSATYFGSINGECDNATAQELRKWIGQKLKAPLGRFKLTAIAGGTLRSDIASLWTTQVQQIKNLGAPLTALTVTPHAQ